MPIKLEWEDLPMEWPGEDMWKKFELETTNAFGGDFGGLLGLGGGYGGSVEDLWWGIEEKQWSPPRVERREIRVHDCMWAGVCKSKDHRTPLLKKVVTVTTTAPAAPGKSLLKPQQQQQQVQQVQQQQPPRPETPQSSSEEETEENTTRKRTMSEGAVVVDPRMVTGQQNRPHSDHDYESKTKPPERMLTAEDLGVQTPSDSEEEEIDVVSVSRGGSCSGTTVTTGAGGSTAGSTYHHPQNRLLSAASEAVSRRLRSPGAVGTPPPSSSSAKRKDRSADHSLDYIEEYYMNPRQRKRPSPRKHSRFSTDSETESTERRSLHNNMERMRRIDLRNAFEELRCLVPGLASPGRAAKVTILRDAAAYCHELTDKSSAMGQTVAALRKKQQKLRSNLSRLRRHLAANR